MIRFLVSVLTFALSAQTLATVAPENSVLKIDPYIATLSVRLLKSETKTKSYPLSALPGRDQVEIFGKMPALDYAYIAGPMTSSPLVFVVPGLGGSTSEGTAQYIGDLLNHAGFSVAVLQQPFSWKFVLKRSPDAVPGFIPEEAKLLATMMNDVKTSLASRGVRPSSYSAVGYSLGAINLGFLEMAEKRGELNVGLRRVLMINPPLDLNFALDRLTRLEKIRDTLTPDQQSVIWGSLMSKAGSLKPIKKGEALQDYLVQALAQINVTRGQAAFLIGETFRQSLTDLMVVSQSVKDRGLLKEPISKNYRNAREAEASNILYSDYMRKFMMPFWQRKQGTNLDAVNFADQGSLVKYTSVLAALSEIRLIHNADDFLTDSSSLSTVDAALGSRSVVFPYGGHVGNLWAPNVQRAIVGALK